MESIVNTIISGDSKFDSIEDWTTLKDEIKSRQEKGDTGKDKTISVLSWRKFYRILNKTLTKNADLFSNSLKTNSSEVRLQESIKEIQKNDVFVIDIAKLDEETQGFVFGDVMKAIKEARLGQTDREDSEIPSKIIIFVDELNKYGSKDVPTNSPILRQLLDITERGRSLGIILFAAEQFRSDIHNRVKSEQEEYIKKIEDAKKKAEEGAKTLEKLKSKGNNHISKIIEKRTSTVNIEIKEKEIEEEKPKFRTEKLSKLNKNDRKFLGEIFTIINNVLTKDLAENLIQKIEEKYK